MKEKANRDRMFNFTTVKRWLYLISLMLFFVANTNAANSDFFGAREVDATKELSKYKHISQII